MATNDFLPFANGGGANVLTQAQYAALTSLLSGGFSAGVAPSVQLNKVWRQSSIMSAVLAQFIANQTGANSVDDGTTATLLANLIAAVSASVPGVVGQVRNLSMSVTAASATATLTADEIIVESALGGLRYCLASFSKTINLATTGAGGMDTGTAPVSGFVALYAIYNPTTQTSALLATNAATLQPNVYGGANMPAGYTASALISAWPTNASRQFLVGNQLDRSVRLAVVSVVSSGTIIATPTAFSLAAVVPMNAKAVKIGGTLAGTVSGASKQISVFSSAQAVDLGYTLGHGVVGVVTQGSQMVSMPTPQTVYLSFPNNTDSASYGILTIGYDF